MSKHEGWLELESDPGVFTLLSKALGVQGVQVEEIYDLNKEVTDHVYGFIFLFCWSDDRRSRRRQSAITEDMQIKDETRLKKMFFARQIITNSCATHALLSVVLNSPDVLLGETLSQFKNNTRDMDAETKGYAIGNVADFAEAHNRHSRPEPISVGTHPEVNGPVLSRSVEAYHYISFVPIDGRLVELDGLKAHPVDHGPIPEGENWTVRFCEVMKERLGSSFDSNQDIRYNLLALVDDRIELCQRRLQTLDARREKLLTSVEQTFCSLVCTPAQTPYETPTTPVKNHPSIPAAGGNAGGAAGASLIADASSLARAFPSASHALVSEPLATLHEAHEQPVCPAVAGVPALSSYAPLMPVTMPPMGRHSIAATALSFHAAAGPQRTGAVAAVSSSSCDPIIAQSVPASNLQLSCAATARDASLLGIVTDSSGGTGGSFSPPRALDPVPSPLGQAPGVDPARVTAALHSSGAVQPTDCGGDDDVVAAGGRDVSGGAPDSQSALAAASSTPPPQQQLNASDQPHARAEPARQPGEEAGGVSAEISSVAFQGLATLAMLAPSPNRQRSPVQQLGLSELARTSASSATAAAAAGGGSSSSIAVASSLDVAVDPQTLSTPKVSVTRSSSPDMLLPLARSADGQQDADEADSALSSSGNEVGLLRSSCQALASSLFAYSGDGNPGAAEPTSAVTAATTPAAAGTAAVSGAATPGGGLLPEDTRGGDVTRAAHVLINVLRQCSGSSVTAEQLPGASIMLEDAAAPLRRDDPETHVRVQAMFREIAEIDGETAGCRKMLSEEESKRHRYKVDHSRRTHNYGPFISTFLVMLAKEGLLQPAIETQHPSRFQSKRCSGGAAVASSGGSVGAPVSRGKKKASAAASSATPVAKRARPGRPPGSKSKKKGAKASAASSVVVAAADQSGSFAEPPDGC